jgi:pimeloyl-ACP methyl ester carboxylesterase
LFAALIRQGQALPLQITQLVLEDFMISKNKIFYLLSLTFIFSALAFAQTVPQEKTVTVFGAKIRYLEAGDPSRPVVIFLHGLGGNAENWQMNTPFFAANYRVIALDQLGFGKSDKPTLKYRVGTYVDFLDKFMSELKIEKAHLVGNSLGGWIAALFSIKYPARVEKLILVDAAGMTPKNFDIKKVYDLNSSTREEVRENLKRVVYNQALASNDALVDQFFTLRVTATDGYTINSLIESIKRQEDFLDNRLGEIKKPTLIIWGRQDGLLLLDEGERYHKGITGSKLVVFEQCGHVPQLEKPAEFNKEVSNFLESK